MCRSEEETTQKPPMNDNDDNSNEVSLEKGTTMSASGGEASIAAPETKAEEDKVSLCSKLVTFYFENEFLILVICAICLARAYPPLGAVYLAPDITATWIAVCIIFFMAGLGLKTEEFYKAFQQIWFNLYVQAFNFGVVSSVTYLISWGLQSANILSPDLADGMVVCASLPMTINMVLVLTKSAGGDESLAIVNAAFGNLVGVFLSPVLILMYLGVTGDINLGEVFYKLALRVVVPVALGQVVQKTMPKVVAFSKEHKKRFKTFQEYALVFIVYTVFCTTFEDDETSGNSSIGDVFKMICFLLLILVTLMITAWITLGLLFHDHPEMRVMGLFGCTHKTVAMGVPLIGAIYGNNALVGMYTLPLLIWHPMQLMIGTFLAPRLAAWVEKENIRLGRNTNTTDDDEVSNSNELNPPNNGGEEESNDVENGSTVEPESAEQELQDEPKS